MASPDGTLKGGALNAAISNAVVRLFGSSSDNQSRVGLSALWVLSASFFPVRGFFLRGTRDQEDWHGQSR